MNSKILLIITAFILIAGGAYYMGTKKPQILETEVATPTPTTEVTETRPSVSTPTATPTVDERETLKTVIKQQLVVKHGSIANEMTISVSKVSSNYASGGASASGGGGGWFAAKVDGAWKLVWDGNGVILCKDLVAYPEFPREMIPECYNDATGRTVTR